ncbi:MAG TPA: cytochrome P450 [Micromonosporaceae bacterium]|nr:cytochrome P450 [Micromonosporaceae bacterium]
MDASVLWEPYERYRLMRDNKPVSQDDQGMWHVYRHQDVLAVLTDHQRFSSQYAFGRNLLGESMIRQDPPRHTRLRKLANQAFTPRRISLLEPRVVEIAHELLDAVAGRDVIDVIADLGSPLPVTVIADLLGIERERRAEFRRWANIFTSLGMRTPDAQEEQALRDMEAYFLDVIDKRRAEPGDDVLSSLVRAEADEGKLTTDELISFCYLLFVAGLDTTTNLVGNMVICLAHSPDVLERVRRDRSLVPALIEETLRYLPPTQANVRVATADAVLSGVSVPAGSRIMVWNASANRDESAFADPDRFDIDRDDTHTTFGHGIHFCLGSSLARLEGRIAITALLDRFPGPWRFPDEPLQRVSQFFLCGVTSLPMWTA